jgi:UDP-glucose 4-epimerase
MILVTGGLGFIGSSLCPLLLQHKHKVRILDNNTTNAVTDIDGAELIEGDICSPFPDPGVWDGVDTIVHLAAIPGVASCAQDPVLARRVNVDGTYNLLRQATHHNVQHFLLASSVGAVLGEQEQPAKEDQVPHPRTAYGSSKNTAEFIINHLACEQLSTCVLRFTNVYGGNSQRKDSIVHRLMRHDVREPFTIYGDGSQARDFIYIEDVCAAIVGAIGRRASGTFHIGSGKKTSVLELVEQVGRIQGHPLTLSFADPRHGDVMESYTSIAKATMELDWLPETDLLVGLAKTWSWTVRRRRTWAKAA